MVELSNVLIIDTETQGLNLFGGDALVGIAIYNPDTQEAQYFYKDFSALHYIMDKHLIFHNAKFDILALYSAGFPLPTSIGDTLIASHLMNENEPHGLKYLSSKYLFEGASSLEEEKLIEQVMLEFGVRGKNKAKANMWRLPPETLAPYAKADVTDTYKLNKFYAYHLEQWGLTDLYEELCNEYLLKVLIPAEIHGMPYDLIKGQQELTETNKQRQVTYNKLERLSYKEFNPNSPKQVTALLNSEDAKKETLLRRIATGEGGKLEELIIEYKKQTKVLAFLNDLDERCVSNRIHGTFNITGTVTGRLSCSKPNLQQMPKGSNIRNCFKAPDGYYFVSIDWDRLELCVAAHFADYTLWIGQLNAHEDLHQHTADALGTTRAKGKNANFGLLYGLGYETASTKWVMPIKETEKIVKGWRRLHRTIVRAYYAVSDRAKIVRPIYKGADIQSKYIKLFTGRFRHFQGLEEWKTKDAWNSLVQGTGSELNRLLAQWFVEQVPDIPLINLMHDEIDLLVPHDRLDEVVGKIKEFEYIVNTWDRIQFKTTMTLGVSYGPSWGEQTEYTS